MKTGHRDRRRVSLFLAVCAFLALGLTALADGDAAGLAALARFEPLSEALGLDQSSADAVQPSQSAEPDTPIVVDFGGAPDAPVAGIDQWMQRQNGEIQAASTGATPITGPKTVVVLRVYFNDYANASLMTQADVQARFDDLDKLWRDTSYNKISIVHRVSTLFQLPSNRSAYIDDGDGWTDTNGNGTYDPGVDNSDGNGDGVEGTPCDVTSGGDLSCDGKYQKVLDDAVANAPNTVDFSNVDAVFVLMAETSNAQFHRGQANKCTLPIGAGGANRTVGCAIFSENPSEGATARWGRWAHEMGHAFQVAGPGHPSNYRNTFELMDASYPGQTGVFEKLDNMGFPGWMPPAKYVEFTPASKGEERCLLAEEYDPASKPAVPQAIKAKITNSLYYMISVRRAVLGDDLRPIPDEGVLIERVSEGADQWVTVQGPGTPPDRNRLWKNGTYSNSGDGIFIEITKKLDDDNYCITVRYTDNANQPDVMIAPWRAAPGNTWETTDIWVDSPVNGYGTFRYGTWDDLRGGTVPRGNGDDPAVNMVNRLYARVRNVGSQTATDIVVKFQITDPPGLGIAGSNGWANLGSVDKNSFPALANLAPGATTDVYIEWTPTFPLTEEQIATGNFYFHTCVRVIINPVAGETVLGNQDGDWEQENINYFQAVNDPDGPRVFDGYITLRNDDLVNPKWFSLSYSNTLPAAWVLDVNGGKQGVMLNPNETRQIPIIIKPQGPAVAGSIYGVDVRASYLKIFTSELDPKDTHPADQELGGARVEARVLLPAKVECEANDFGEIVVKGKLSEVDEKFLTGRVPLRVMVQGVDGKRRFIGDAAQTVDVNKDGSFEGTIYSQKERIEEVMCLFAGTDMLASAGSGYVRVPSNTTSPLPTKTRTAVPTRTPTPTATRIPQATNTPTATPTPQYALLPYRPVLELQQPILLNQDLSIFGIEVTQGIQCFDTSRGLANCPDNSLPVALGKLTAARVYLKYNHPLFSTRNNTPVRFYLSVNNGPWQSASTLATARSTLDQSQANFSANFLFTIGGNSQAVVRIYAVVDHNSVITETNESNNRFPSSGYVTMTFRPRENLKILSRPLDYNPPGYTGTRFAQGWAVNGGAANWFNQLLPIRNGGISHSVSSGRLDWTTSLGNSNGQHALIQHLNGEYALLVIFNALFGNINNIPDQIYGWAPNSGYSGGHADMPVYPHAGGLGVVGIGTDRVGGSPSTDNPGGGTLIFGHELVHDYDEKHTNTADSCGSSDSSTAYPYASSSIQEFGFNPATLKVYNPNNTHDLMSYCPAGGSREGWISPYTWTQMFNKLATTSAEAAQARGAEGEVLAAQPGFFTLYRTGHSESVIVNLTVNNPANNNGSESGSLGNLYKVDSGFNLTLPEGDYAVELRNANQQVLSTQTFKVDFQSEYNTSGEGHTHAAGTYEEFDPNPTKQVDITLVAPWVDGTTSIALTYKGKVLDQRTISGNPPTVKFTDPTTEQIWKAGENRTLKWEGSDPDKDTLHYAVFYSHDGGKSWQLLASELAESSLTLAVDTLAGGVDTRFRVVATDGVNTAIGETPLAIEVPNKAPMAIILEPSAVLAEPGTIVVLRGSATDLEDGSLAGDKLTWTSNVQGELGKGYEVAINTLSTGKHTLTLTAIDSQGISGSASVEIIIGYGLHLPAVAR